MPNKQEPAVQALVGVDAREATSPLMTEVADRPAASPEPAMLFFVPGAAPGAGAKGGQGGTGGRAAPP